MSTWHIRLGDNLDNDVEVGKRFPALCKEYDINLPEPDPEGTIQIKSWELRMVIRELTKLLADERCWSYTVNQGFNFNPYVIPIGTSGYDFYYTSQLFTVLSELTNLYEHMTMGKDADMFYI